MYLMETFQYLFGSCYDYKEINYAALRHEVLFIRVHKN